MLLSLALALGLATTSSASSSGPKKKARTPKLEQTISQPSAPQAEPDSLFTQITVGPSQTASWLGFRHLGAWSPDIAAKVASDNPGISSLDQLRPGQLLKLRKSFDQRRLTPAQQVSKAIRKAVVTLVKGQATLFRPGAQETPLQANMFLSVGDRISTGTDASVELIIDNQSVLRLRDKTTLSLVSIQDSTPAQKVGTSVFLETGRVWSKIRKWAGPLVGFQVKMPNAIAGVHGTTFVCKVATDSTSMVEVLEGVVGVKGSAQTQETAVRAGKTVRVSKDGTVSEPLDATGSPKEESDPSTDSILEEHASNLLETMNSIRSPIGQQAKASSASDNTSGRYPDP